MIETTPDHGNGDDKSRDGERWFATFTLLDAGGAISSWQYRRLLTVVVTVWRRIVAPVIGLRNMLKKPRCIGC